MIIVTKFRGRFRERFPEWVTSIGIFWWGMVALLIPKLFHQPYFFPLNLLMTQPFWGLAATLIGFGACVSLLINGVWRPTAHIRAIFSVLKITLWSTLLVASAASPGRELGIPTFAMLVALDIGALWWAAGDARLADDLAKNKKQVANGV
jgi:hypothetical protein